MQVKTIMTAAGVNEIDFGNDNSQSTAHFYWLKNLGDSTLYVSANPNPIAEKDDVAELPAKGAVSVETDEGKIYVLGAGKVEIHRTNSKFCPFEWQSSGSGGGGGGSITVDSELSDTSTNPLQNKVTTAAIKEVNSTVETLEAALETKSDINHIHDISASGNPVQIDGLQGGVPFSEMVVSGDNIIGQDLTVNVCGKNLMKPNKSTVTLNGITATMNDDGSVTLNGTATANTYIGMWNNLYARSIGVGKIAVNAIDGQSISTYFMGIDRREGSSYIDRIAQSITNNGVGEITQEDVDNNRHFYVWVFIAANYTSNNLVFRPQLELGSTPTAYEPYHGSTTTITPDSNPYVIPNDIRQQEGLNVVSVSAGELSVVGVQKNAAVKKIWDEIGIDLLFDGTVTTGTNCITESINEYNFLYFYGNLSSVSGESSNVTGSLVIPKTARAILAGQSLVVTTGVIYITVNIINIESGVMTFTVTPSDSSREIYEFKVFGIK